MDELYAHAAPVVCHHFLSMYKGISIVSGVLGIEADVINLLLALTPVGFVQQRQTWGQKGSSFSWATFGWASCIIDNFVTFV